jgi:hypothetical protein
MSNYRTAVALTAALLLLAIVAGTHFVRDVRVPTNNPVVIGTPAADATDGAFRAGFLPLVQRAAMEAQVLVAMGEDRERNLFLIREQQQLMLERLGAADAWLEANTPPAPLAPAAAAYRDGAVSIRAAMAEAQAGFLRFDFERVARATERMREGTAALRLAVSYLDDGNSPATDS